MDKDIEEKFEMHLEIGYVRFNTLVEQFDKLTEKLEDIEDSLCLRFNQVVDEIQKTNPEKIEKYLLKIIDVLEVSEKNATKCNDMIKELKGCVSMTRSLFNHRKNNTPVWYEIEKVDLPPTGEVWIKDINGVETLATCKGRALIYPASSELHMPEFWKPI